MSATETDAQAGTDSAAFSLNTQAQCDGREYSLALVGDLNLPSVELKR